MEKDTLTHVEAPVTQASNRDPGPAAAPPDVQTPLEGTSRGVNVGQESWGPGESKEMENMSVLILNPSAKAIGQRPEAGPVDATGQQPRTQGNAGRKDSRKRRNRKQTKIVYLPWPLTLQTRASSAAPVLGRSRFLGALASADPRNSKMGEVREQVEDEESENASTLTEPQKEFAEAMRPAASAVQPSLEEAPLAAHKGLNSRQKKSRKGRNKRNKKIMASPWPLTVHAWASYADSAQAQPASAGDESLAKGGVVGGHPTLGPKGEVDNVSAETPCESAQEKAPGAAEDPEQGSWEKGESLSAQGKGDEGKSRQAESKRKKGVLACPWPLTVQAWASFRAADEVQTHLLGKCSAASMGVDVGQKKLLQPETGEEEIMPTRPVSKAERAPEARQGRRNTERCRGDQDFWKCTVRNFARQVDRCYCGERCSQERREALTLTKAHTHISTSVMGIRGPERERAETQAVWMGKWGGF